MRKDKRAVSARRTHGHVVQVPQLQRTKSLPAPVSSVPPQMQYQMSGLNYGIIVLIAQDISHLPNFESFILIGSIASGPNLFPNQISNIITTVSFSQREGCISSLVCLIDMGGFAQ